MGINVCVDPSTLFALFENYSLWVISNSTTADDDDDANAAAVDDDIISIQLYSFCSENSHGSGFISLTSSETAFKYSFCQFTPTYWILGYRTLI